MHYTLSILVFLTAMPGAMAQNDSLLRRSGSSVMDFAGPFISIDAGSSLLIPLRTYQERFGYDTFHSDQGAFEVQPSFSWTTANLSVNYSGAIYKRRRWYLGTVTSIGFRHQERRNVKTGSYTGGEHNSVNFTGTVRNRQHDLQIVSYSGLRHAHALGQRVLVVNEVGLLLTYSFYMHQTSSEVTNASNIRNSSSGRTTQAGILSMHYKLGTIIRLNNRFWVYSFFEIPLVSSASFMQPSSNIGHEEVSPYSATPFPSSIDNAAYLSFNVGVTILLKTLKK